jgi:small subunit ribosomal protein S27e
MGWNCERISSGLWLEIYCICPWKRKRKKQKKKQRVQSPNSYFIDVKCPGCYKITMVFSHTLMVALDVVEQCSLLQGGKAWLKEGYSFRRK